MYKEKKSMINKIPVWVLAIILVISGMLKVTGIHPMLDHFVTMGISFPVIKLLGAPETIFSVLFVYPATRKIGLLLLTAYFGGGTPLSPGHGAGNAAGLCMDSGLYPAAVGFHACCFKKCC